MVGVSNPKSCPAIVEAVVLLLAQERAQQGMSMNKLAELTGLALTTISYFERGFRKPTLETALRVAAALDADLGALIQSAVKAIQRQRGNPPSVPGP